MKRRKRTLRGLTPVAKELCQLANDLDRVNRRLINLSDEVHRLEMGDQAVKRLKYRAEGQTEFNKEGAR